MKSKELQPTTKIGLDREKVKKRLNVPETGLSFNEDKNVAKIISKALPEHKSVD